MQHLKPIFASLAAAGMLVAQPAAGATDARAPSSVAESEQLAGGIPSAAWPAIIAILAVAIFAVINAESDDDPVSP